MVVLLAYILRLQRSCAFFLTHVKNESEKFDPDAMYGNLYVSGCVSSEASATANSPLLTTSTVTTGTLNQPQPQSPSGTVATAPLQSHRDAGPHLAGNEACLCSSCHIKDSFFPRSHDGSIVLPHPSLSVHPVRLPRPTASAMTNVTPLATPSVVPRKRHRAESTPSNHDRQ